MKRFITAFALLALSLAAAADTTAIVGGQVHTVGPRGTIDNATIIIRGDKIIAVGSGIPVPEGATTIDATGQNYYSRYFSALLAGWGLVEVSSSAGPNDYCTAW